jgi:hypothetical protein
MPFTENYFLKSLIFTEIAVQSLPPCHNPLSFLNVILLQYPIPEFRKPALFIRDLLTEDAYRRLGRNLIEPRYHKLVVIPPPR